MTTQPHIKLVQEGDYLAEVEVQLQVDESGWSPYLSASDALKLDYVRKALQQRDFEEAMKLARVFRLTPISLQKAS